MEVNRYEKQKATAVVKHSGCHGHIILDSSHRESARPPSTSTDPGSERKSLEHVSGGGVHYQNSCQSHFSGVCLVFEVFQERACKEMLAVYFLILHACFPFSEMFQTRVAHFCFALFA